MTGKSLCVLAAIVWSAACARADVDWPSTFAADVAAATASHAGTAASGTGTLEASVDSLVGGWSALDLALSAVRPFDSRSRTWVEAPGIVINGSKPRGAIMSFR